MNSVISGGVNMEIYIVEDLIFDSICHYEYDKEAEKFINSGSIISSSLMVISFDFLKTSKSTYYGAYKEFFIPKIGKNTYLCLDGFEIFRKYEGDKNIFTKSNPVNNSRKY